MKYRKNPVRKSYRISLLFYISMVLWILSPICFALEHSETLIAKESELLPLIDGNANDKSWEKTDWQPIDHLWMEWDATVEPNDFHGRFKILWNYSENLLYFLVEIIDDFFIGEYRVPAQGYPNYYLVEIFIDENMSGGLHVFDDIIMWGKNAENAFSYHILPSETLNQDHDYTESFFALDIAGTNWETVIIRNYERHIPEFALSKHGNKYIWEFALAVYDDTNDHTNPEASRVQLEAEKMIGLIVAYCDNDEDDGERDHFFASVAGDASKLSIEKGKKIYNEAWKNADNYGTLILKSVDETP